MEKVLLPLNDAKANCPIFVSADWARRETVCVLSCGSGAVRAGQWARSLCMCEQSSDEQQISFRLFLVAFLRWRAHRNETLNEGSQLPYVKQCLDNGWGVVVINHNQTADADGKPVRRCATPR